MFDDFRQYPDTYPYYPVSVPGANYFSSINRFHGFFGFTSLLALQQMRTPIYGDREEHTVGDEYASHAPLLAELAVCRTYDAYVSYCTELLALVVYTRSGDVSGKDPNMAKRLSRSIGADGLFVDLVMHRTPNPDRRVSSQYSVCDCFDPSRLDHVARPWPFC